MPAELIGIEVEGPSFGSQRRSRIDLVITLGDTYDGRKCIAVGECKTSLSALSNLRFKSFIKSQLLNIGRLLSRDDKLGYPFGIVFL